MKSNKILLTNKFLNFRVFLGMEKLLVGGTYIWENQKR